MQLTATGTVINFSQGTESPFTMTFNLAGGVSQSAGCDTTLMNAQVTDFSAVIGGQAIAAPTSFLGNMSVSPYPTCSGPQQVEITNATGPQDASNWLTLSYANNPASPGAHSTFTGSVNGYYIASASYQVTPTAAPELSLSEPSGLVLMACALAILLGRKVVIARR